ncbi:MAG: flavin reductase family protein [Thermoplasmatota archaeon]
MYHLLYPLRSFLIVSGTETPDVMTADWVTVISRKPLLVGVSVAPGRTTHELIKKEEAFVISVPSKEMLDDVWTAGTKSGPSKTGQMNVTFIPSQQIAVPGIKEALANVECRVVDSPTYGDHTLFVGEVVGHSVDSDAYDGTTPITPERFLAHIGGSRFVSFSSEEMQP